MTNSPNKTFLVIGAIFGLLAVITGALGAHALSKFVTPDVLQTYETGVRFQFFHVFALLVVGILGSQFSARLSAWTGGLFSVGILLFSGSLYLITALKAGNLEIPTAVGLLTPLGGVCLIAGWTIFLIAAFQIPKNS